MRRRVTQPGITERQLLDAVVAYARLRDWLAYHTFDSRRSEAGFPDVVLVRGGRLVFVELKVAGRRPRVEQQRYLERLRGVELEAAGAVAVHVWTEAEWRDGTVEAVLR
jgi:hypothetical protein